ncbi:lysoplasmalogenase family protein [Hydrogenophaga sp.]|uniref:lysoplasmalogenase family protein n=1 Tax=Hydrogenophaga sp. TaxID=1904254 RepID=UPI0025C325F2|nr:lysoplasmalogenase family protein [Hydrogenophaga sp.]
MSPSQIIVLATPVFLALIAVEYAAGRARGRNTYRLDDAVTSIGLGMLSQVSAVFTRLLRIGIYTAVYGVVALSPDTGFWTSWGGWLLALLFYDFCYYWHHRLGHTCALFWAAHVVHHQSQDYNLSTALRQTSSGALFGWVFYLPMAVAGVPPLVFGVVALVDLLYQYWIHTQQIGKLGWFDRVFASPSNHRVHHAVNDRYLDKNYGGILILWDQLFGSYADEDDGEPCVYGTRSPLNSWDPLWANAEVYVDLARDSWHTRRWTDKLRVWFQPPGWRPADVSHRFPKPAFDIGQVRTFAPPLSPNVQRFTALQFIALLAGSGAYLWLTDSWPLSQSAVWLAVLLTGLWSVGAVMQGRIGMLEALMIECAALTMATSATGLVELHRLFKPLTMGLALMVVAQAGLVARGGGGSPPHGIGWLLAALAASLAGDAFLMFDGFFLPGLLAFLLAHLAYTALFRQDAPLLAAPRATLVIALVGLAVYAVLWTGGLPAALRAPVAVYVLAIAVMASWAVSRAKVLGDGPAWAVAVGAICFLISDATLAVNRFVMPLPHSAVWVLGTYYAAQCLMVMGWLRGRRASQTSGWAAQGA